MKDNIIEESAVPEDGSLSPKKNQVRATVSKVWSGLKKGHRSLLSNIKSQPKYATVLLEFSVIVNLVLLAMYLSSVSPV